jgi:cellulose synthase operon protein YhjQ
MLKIAFVSANGGVGKTALTANLASLLARRGQPVLALDFDPNNLLSLHFGLMPDEADGIAARLVDGGAWQQAAFSNAEGVRFLPFGELDELQRAAFGKRLGEDPEWLANRLDEIAMPDHTLALVDTPRLPSIYAQQAIAAADLVIAVVAADASCYAKLPALRRSIAASGKLAATYYVVNFADAARRLHNDIIAVLRMDLGERLLPYFIHHDEAVPESLASNRGLADYAPHGQAAHDMQGLAAWLLERHALPKAVA